MERAGEEEEALGGAGGEAAACAAKREAMFPFRSAIGYERRGVVS